MWNAVGGSNLMQMIDDWVDRDDGAEQDSRLWWPDSGMWCPWIRNRVLQELFVGLDKDYLRPPPEAMRAGNTA
jgi:hypothetical protein